MSLGDLYLGLLKPNFWKSCLLLQQSKLHNLPFNIAFFWNFRYDVQVSQTEDIMGLYIYVNVCHVSQKL